MSTLDKDTFRKDLLDAFEPTTHHGHQPSLVIVVFAVFFLALVGWVTADIWAAVHNLS